MRIAESMFIMNPRLFKMGSWSSMGVWFQISIRNDIVSCFSFYFTSVILGEAINIGLNLNGIEAQQ